MKVYLKPEPTTRAYLLRVLMGWAMLLDSLIQIFTLSTIASQFALRTARELAKERLKHERNQ